ncbi:trypsin-like peptidase domain-containing protein [Spirillospora sp. NPDC052242]
MPGTPAEPADPHREPSTGPSDETPPHGTPHPPTGYGTGAAPGTTAPRPYGAPGEARGSAGTQGASAHGAYGASGAYGAFGVPGAYGTTGAAGARGVSGVFGGPGGPGRGARRPGGIRRAVALGAAALALAVGAGAGGAAAALALTDEPARSAPTAVTGASNASGSVSAVAAAVLPSVVSITAQSGAGGSGGSGVILSADGTIVTNAHVVDGAQQVAVKFSDGRTAQARVVGGDRTNDIAVLKAQGVSGLKPASFGTTEGLAVGDQVLAIGSPLGLDGSVTSGIVSALGRQVSEGSDQPEQRAPWLPPGLQQELSQEERTVIENAIQTDAPINPGNSGGALVNMSGQVIGINTAILTSGSGSGSIGLGFAIPIDSAKQTASKIIAAASV